MLDRLVNADQGLSAQEWAQLLLDLQEYRAYPDYLDQQLRWRDQENEYWLAIEEGAIEGGFGLSLRVDPLGVCNINRKPCKMQWAIAIDSQIVTVLLGYDPETTHFVMAESGHYFGWGFRAPNGRSLVDLSAQEGHVTTISSEHSWVLEADDLVSSGPSLSSAFTAEKEYKEGIDWRELKYEALSLYPSLPAATQWAGEWTKVHLTDSRRVSEQTLLTRSGDWLRVQLLDTKGRLIAQYLFDLQDWDWENCPILVSIWWVDTLCLSRLVYWESIAHAYEAFSDTTGENGLILEHWGTIPEELLPD